MQVGINGILDPDLLPVVPKRNKNVLENVFGVIIVPGTLVNQVIYPGAVPFQKDSERAFIMRLNQSEQDIIG